MTTEPAPLIRSMLFIPANRTRLASKGLAAGADALVFDLEDAIPMDAKEQARAELNEYLCGPPKSSAPTFVRVNPLSDLRGLEDLEAVVCANLAGVLVPKVEGPGDITVLDQTLRWLEERAGMSIGQTRIVPLLESAQSMRLAYEIASASPRVAYMGGIGVKGGDVEHALGYRWSPGGEETLVMRSKTLLDVRAAGIENPLSGVWMSLDDESGLEAFAQQTRSLGYEGMLAIHPRHIPIINDAFTPTPEEVERDRRIIAALSDATDSGAGAINFEGNMIDEAMAAAAQKRLERFGFAEVVGSPRQWEAQ